MTPKKTKSKVLGQMLRQTRTVTLGVKLGLFYPLSLI